LIGKNQRNKSTTEAIREVKMEQESRSYSFPMLTRSNWHSEFRTAFREFALTCGEAGEAIITGVNNDMPEPSTTAVRERYSFSRIMKGETENSSDTKRST
jgi:hypothetical protein